MRSNFDTKLELLKSELIEMGSMCENAISLVTSALEGNRKGTERIIQLEDQIDHMERTIENLCLRLLLREQPVAHDLRQVSAALKLITDLERIGDQASDIWDILAALGPGSEDTQAVAEMSKQTKRMVSLSIDAYVQQDSRLAKQVIELDDAVDASFDEIKGSLIDRIAMRPESGSSDLDLLMIAKYLERIGDHAVNVAEWVIFSIDGIHK